MIMEFYIFTYSLIYISKPLEVNFFYNNLNTSTAICRLYSLLTIHRQCLEEDNIAHFP